MLSDSGTLTSVREGWSVNLTAALLAVVRGGLNLTDVSFAHALALPSAVLATVATALAQRPFKLDAGEGGVSEFSLTLSGPTRLVLRAAANQSRAFAPGMSAVLGLAACAVQGISDAGDLLLLATPPTAAVCPVATAAGVECGHVTLSLNTSVGSPRSARRRSLARPSAPAPSGTRLPCSLVAGTAPLPSTRGALASRGSPRELPWEPPRYLLPT